MGFLWRWLFALGLLTATYNPTQYNYARWVVDYGNANLSIAVLNSCLGLIALSLVLGIGRSWSHVRRRLSGQSDMDDVDD